MCVLVPSISPLQFVGYQYQVQYTISMPSSRPNLFTTNASTDISMPLAVTYHLAIIPITFTAILLSCCFLNNRRSLFKGNLVIHAGGGASGFNSGAEGDSYDTDGVCLFHVKGTQPDNTYGVQV